MGCYRELRYDPKEDALPGIFASTGEVKRQYEDDEHKAMEVFVGWFDLKCQFMPKKITLERIDGEEDSKIMTYFGNYRESGRVNTTQSEYEAQGGNFDALFEILKRLAVKDGFVASEDGNTLVKKLE